MRLDELVSMDLQGEFRSDVQLNDYDNERLNRELLRKYIFTVYAPTTIGATQRDYAAKDVLDMLKTALTVERSENRIVLTANYGHGKSHLALVLANFFARPENSEEVQIILGRLSQALNNPPQFSGYKDLKHSKGEFLVIRLQGDRCEDLQESFIRALEKALSEHSATRSIEMPFWYKEAESWLNSLAEQERRKAETFLAEQKTDLPSLTADLRKQGSYELVRDLARHINGFYPDFGGAVTLEDLVKWAVDEVCVPHQLGGLLVLFDEFSLFLQKYAASRRVGKLQELLNGISNRPGKCAFLAFSQHDVNTIADTYAQGERREDIRRELDRLPRDKRGRLFSLMESVLDSYLKQDETAWEQWRSQQPVKAALVRAREIVLEHFGNHYSTRLHWNTEAFEQKVIKGCFPLHPLTTAILSVHNFDFGTSENPRTALQFVRKAWEYMSSQPAQQQDGAPNFIFPIALVEFFGEQISKKWYEAYQNAIETAPIAISDEQRKVLQALLLQQAVGLKAAAGGQIDLLTHLSGLTRDVLKRCLKELADQRIVQSDSINKVTSLWPASTRPQEVEEIIQKAIRYILVDQSLMDKIVSGLPTIVLTGSAHDFGHEMDWSPRQVALTAEMFNESDIKSLLKPYRAGTGGIEEGLRGVVIWLIAQSEEEKTHLRQNAQAVLDAAIGNGSHPVPVVIVLPKRPVLSLIETARRLTAIEKLSGTDRERIGTVIYQQELESAKINFKTALDDLTGGVEGYADIQRNSIEYAVPALYRASIQALRNLSLKNVISECYRQAYAYRVEFYTQYPVVGRGPNQLRNAVQKVARGLFSDEIGGTLPALGRMDIQYQVITAYLQTRWGLVARETYKIQPPTLRVLREAWDRLESVFPPGCKEIRASDILLSLLNPPYGHDYNTLTLLLAAWIGYRHHEIHLSFSGQIFSLEQLKKHFDDSRTPQDFLNKIIITTPLYISRANPDEMFAEVNEIIEKIRENNPFTIVDAQQALIKLDQALTNPMLPPAHRESIGEHKERLNKAHQQALEYDRKVLGWLAEFGAADFKKLLGIRSVLTDLTWSPLVVPSQPGVDDLCRQWDNRLENELEIFCERNIQLRELSEYKSHKAELNDARRQLKEYPSLAEKVDQALQKLEQRYEELKRAEDEKPIVAAIQNMATSAGLSTLYEYRDRLEKYKNLSPSTEKLRESKAAQIDNQIRQYEQLVEMLSFAVEKVSRLADLNKQKELLLRNLEQTKETPIHQKLTALQKEIEQLEGFFEQVQNLDQLPHRSPEEVDFIRRKIGEVETQYTSYLSSAQKDLLIEKKREIETYRSHEISIAKAWLRNLADSYKRGEDPDVLLDQLKKPPEFLPQEERKYLEQFKQALIKKINDNKLLLIESEFKKLDSESRRQCLKRLQELIDKP
jgi:hypothetical protein